MLAIGNLLRVPVAIPYTLSNWHHCYDIYTYLVIPRVNNIYCARDIFGKKLDVHVRIYLKK